MEFEFAKPLQYTSFKWNPSHISGTYIKFQPSTHVIVHCTYYAPLLVVSRVEVEPEQEVMGSLHRKQKNFLRLQLPRSHLGDNS